MRKKTKSKLDQFAETLEAMELQGKTCVEMVAWLKDEGCTASEPTVSRFLDARRNARWQDQLLINITSGAQQCAEVNKQFAKNPAPDLEALIKLLRVSILNLTTQAQANPELLKLVNELTRTVMEFVSGQTKAMHKERELRVTEGKFARESVKLFIEWAKNEEAMRIASSPMPQAEKLEKLGQKMFGELW